MDAESQRAAAPRSPAPPEPSSTHLVLIPSFNPGPKVFATVRDALAQWAPVWVVVDGSTDQSAHGCRQWPRRNPACGSSSCRRIAARVPRCLFGLREAQALGFTHALTMDSDGQHPAEQHPGVHAGVDGLPQRHGAGPPGVRCQRPEPAGQGPQNLELVGQSRNPVGRHRRLPVWLSRLSHRGPDRASCAGSPGCGASISTWRRWCVCAGAASGPSIYRRRCATFAPRKAASRISITGATMCLLTWMHFRLFWGFLLRLPLLWRAALSQIRA